MMKNLSVITVILITLFSIACSSTKYEMYSNYGLSIEYPEGRSITANVVADESSGVVTNSPTASQLETELDKIAYLEMFHLSWETMSEAPDLGAALESFFETWEGAVGEGKFDRFIVLGGNRVSGYPVRARGYSIQSDDLQMGLWLGVWYCERQKRLYKLQLVRSGDALGWALTEGMEEYERYLRSFVCSDQIEAVKVPGA